MHLLTIRLFDQAPAPQPRLGRPDAHARGSGPLRVQFSIRVHRVPRRRRRHEGSARRESLWMPLAFVLRAQRAPGQKTLGSTSSLPVATRGFVTESSGGALRDRGCDVLWKGKDAIQRGRRTVHRPNSSRVQDRHLTLTSRKDERVEVGNESTYMGSSKPKRGRTVASRPL